MTLKKIDNDTWSTMDELRFIQNYSPKKRRILFLQDYKEALELRSKWKGLDRKKVFTCINKEIQKELKGE